MGPGPPSCSKVRNLYTQVVRLIFCEFSIIITISLHAGDHDRVCELQINTSTTDKTEMLFQCDKGSGKFFALCTQDSNYSACFSLPVSTGCGNNNSSEIGIVILLLLCQDDCQD